MANFLGSALGAIGGGIVGLMGGPIGALTGLAVGSGFDQIMAGEDANKANIRMQEETNAKNIAMTKETNNQAIELANTAHQREVLDLKAAGLNPILSAKYGGSASPSLATPSGVSPVTQSLAPQYESSARGVSTAYLGQQNLIADLAVKKAQVISSSALANKTNTEAVGQAIENYKAKAKLPADVLRSKLDAKATKSRLLRPKGTNDAGWALTDMFGTVTGPLGNIFH